MFNRGKKKQLDFSLTEDEVNVGIFTGDFSFAEVKMILNRIDLNSFHVIQGGKSKLTIKLFPCLAGTTREHLGLAMALKVPIFIVVSKVDLCSRGTVERTVRQLERVLKQPGCNKVPMVVSNPDDAVTAAQQFTQSTWWVQILLTLLLNDCLSAGLGTPQCPPGGDRGGGQGEGGLGLLRLQLPQPDSG